jgi:hypothetical protein
METKYRVKCTDEMVAEFGEDWRKGGKINSGYAWPKSKDVLLGIDVPDYLSEKILIYSTQIELCWAKWYVSKEMLILKKPLVQAQYRIKTEEEFIAEFGENWRHIVFGCIHDDNKKDLILGLSVESNIGDILWNQPQKIITYNFGPIATPPRGSNGRWDISKKYLIIITNNVSKPLITIDNNGKESINNGQIIKVFIPIAAISIGEVPTGTPICGRAKRVTIKVGHLSNESIFGF